MRGRRLAALGAAALLALAAGCGDDDDGGAAGDGATAEPFALSSSAYGMADPIPARFTCDGDDVSPPLAWTAPPEGTASLAVLMDDLDAPGGTFTHWTGWDIPGSATGLEEGEGAPVQGTTDSGTTGYGGPCPPPGEEHRYVLTLYALDDDLGLVEGADREEFDAALEDRTLGRTTLIGTFTRGGG